MYAYILTNDFNKQNPPLIAQVHAVLHKLHCTLNKTNLLNHFSATRPFPRSIIAAQM